MAGIASEGPGTLVLAGPSGVGKGTLINKLKAEFGEIFGFSVSHTTRNPRPGEVDKVHYNFVKHEDMEREIAEGKFLESAHVKPARCAAPPRRKPQGCRTPSTRRHPRTVRRHGSTVARVSRVNPRD